MEREIKLFELEKGNEFKFNGSETIFVVKSVNSKTVLFYEQGSKSFVLKRDIYQNVVITKIN